MAGDLSKDLVDLRASGGVLTLAAQQQRSDGPVRSLVSPAR
jgi:hypothetical protein